MDLSESMLVAQSFLILCHSMDCSLLGSSVYGILQARILEWVAISFSMGSSRPRDWTQVSCIAGIFFAIWAILWVHLVWDCFSWAWMSVSFYRFGKFSAVISSNMFSAPFPFSLPLGHFNVNVSILDVVSEALKPSLFVKFSFFFFFFAVQIGWFYYSVSQMFICSSVPWNLQLIPSYVFSITVIVLSTSDFFFSYSFWLFVEVLTVFIHSSPKFRDHLYDHFFKLCIRSFTYLFIMRSVDEGLSSFIWKIFLCFLILFGSLCLFLCSRQEGYMS